MAGPGSSRPPVVSLRNGAIALVVSGVIVGVVLWGTFVFPFSPPSNVGCSPCGTPFAIGSPIPAGGPGAYSYSMMIAPSSEVHWGATSLEIQSSTGRPLTPISSWMVIILSSGSGNGSPVASYDFATSSWTTGGSVLATSAQVIFLQLGATDLHGQGDNFVMLLSPTSSSGQGGTVSVSLP
jgi:hypothetical protein